MNHKARMEAELEVACESKTRIEERISGLEDEISVIDKIIENMEVDYS